MKTRSLITVTVLFFIIIFLGAFTLKLSASAKKDTGSSGIHYKTIKIKENDSLWSISEKYSGTLGISTNEYIEKLKEINGLSSSLIINGTYIIIPIGL